MKSKIAPLITIFEHESLFLEKGEQRLDNEQLLALQLFYGEKGVPYFSLIHKGVKFCEYVGVIQVGNTIIEVLPKVDRNGDKDSWRLMLIGMLKAVGVFYVYAPTDADLKLKNNSILDLYFEWFISLSEQLLHRGLVKRYNKIQGNNYALKGSLLFGKHIQQNLTHQERFYTRYTTYDKLHPLNCIIYKTINLLKRINTNADLNSRIGSLLLNFPELPDIKISDSLFEKIEYNRKTEPYKKAMEIARLLLLNYHPDVSKGKNNVLALMFDMNLLWERFVYISLRKNKPSEKSVTPQSRRDFWKPEKGNKTSMKPDIIINKDKMDCIVLDTKWKNINGGNPSPDDLRQLYVYSKFHNNAKSALVYPGENNNYFPGEFYDETDEKKTRSECGIFMIKVETNIKRWQKDISDKLLSTSFKEKSNSTHYP